MSDQCFGSFINLSAFVFLGALRFLRKILGLKDEQYNLAIVRNNLFLPIVEVFKVNKRRYNLLNSALIELFEYIRQVRIVPLSLIVDTSVLFL